MIGKSAAVPETSDTTQLLRVEQRTAIAKILENFEQMKSAGTRVKIAGRLKEVRNHGAVIFSTIDDSTGSIQLIVQGKTNPMYQIFNSKLNRWDMISIEGGLATTRNGTKSITVESLEVLATCKRQLLPGRLTDPEKRAKQRYLDLLTNDDTKTTFTRVSRALSRARGFMLDEGFLEFETQLLKPQYDGGGSKPFITFHDNLKKEFFLRVTSEMQLKQLLVGGYERVFEVGKSFRNEGIGNLYHPEFTILEAYIAFSDHDYVMNLIERLIRQVALTAVGSDTIAFGGKQVELGKPWRRMTAKEAILQYASIDLEQLRRSPALLSEIAQKFKIEDNSFAQVVDKLLEKAVRPNLIQPTFITELPCELSPFSKPIADRSDYAMRAWGYAGGLDLCDIFSDENDPEKVRVKFEEQDRLLAEKTPYNHLHEDFVDSLTYGLPDSAGVGLSMSRLFMLLADKQNIRDVILFPHI